MVGTLVRRYIEVARAARKQGNEQLASYASGKAAGLLEAEQLINGQSSMSEALAHVETMLQTLAELQAR